MQHPTWESTGHILHKEEQSWKWNSGYPRSTRITKTCMTNTYFHQSLTESFITNTQKSSTWRLSTGKIYSRCFQVELNLQQVVKDKTMFYSSWQWINEGLTRIQSGQNRERKLRRSYPIASWCLFCFSRTSVHLPWAKATRWHLFPACGQHHLHPSGVPESIWNASPGTASSTYYAREATGSLTLGSAKLSGLLCRAEEWVCLRSHSAVVNKGQAQFLRCHNAWAN